MYGIWITWENQRRNKGISGALGWELYEIIYEKTGIYRYFLSFIKTVHVILKENPKVVAAQNPSIVLALIVILLKKILGFNVLIDAHNSGLYPLEGRSAVMMFFSKMIQRYADLTLVTNESLRSVVESNGGNAFILPDKIPSAPEIDQIPLHGRVNIVFICTFGEDEPYTEVIKATGKLPDDVYIYFTGNFKGKIDADSIPANVRMLGFVPDFEYWSLLSSADIIMDLTTREECLVCGAYEAIALSKPLILSDTKALKSYFNKGCIYVASNSDSIAQGIDKAIETSVEMSTDITELKQYLTIDWENRLISLKDVINSLGLKNETTM